MHGARNRQRLTSDAFNKRVTEMVEEELASALNDLEKQVEDEVHRLVPGILPALLGLRRSWNEWEVVYRSTLDKEHPLGEEFKRVTHETAQRVLGEALEGWAPSKGMLNAVRKAYNDALLDACEERARIIAYQHAEEWGENFVKETLAAFDVEEEKEE